MLTPFASILLITTCFFDFAFSFLKVKNSVDFDDVLAFQLPAWEGEENFSSSSKICARHTGFYCTLLWVPLTERKRLVSPRNETEIMEHLARLNYQKINWFTLGAFYGFYQNNCCNYQLYTYNLYGKMNGFSPYEYMEGLMDINRERHLREVRVIYSSNLCGYLIESLHFSHYPPKGLMIWASERPTSYDVTEIFMFVRGHKYEVFTFSVEVSNHMGYKAVPGLTYSLFKSKVICAGHPQRCSY